MSELGDLSSTWKGATGLFRPERHTADESALRQWRRSPRIQYRERIRYPLKL